MNNILGSRNSIYCYHDSDVLINKLDIHDSNKLFELEKQIVLAKLYILRQNKISLNFDKKHFLYIHKFLFEDIYHFAGELRTEDISKDSFTFAHWEYIDDQLDHLLNSLKEEQYLYGLSKSELAKRLAFYLSELNVLHPFREGNGRTIREFIRELAYKNGYLLDLTQTTPHDIFTASVKSVSDPTDLEQIIFKCLQLDSSHVS